MPKISVLIPNYNYARFLPEAIDSVLQQDLEDFELVIADNASTDGSAAVIARYAAADRRIRSQVHPTNLGMAENFNWCLSHARGEFIKFLLSDDKLASRRTLRVLADLFEKHPTATLAASARQLLYENSSGGQVWDHFGRPGLRPGAEVIARCLFLSANLIGEPSAVMFRRNPGVGGFNPGYLQLIDLEMWFRLLETGDFVYTPEPLCCFRRHHQQETELNRLKGLGQDETIRLFLQYHRKPYLASFGSRRLLFRRLYELKKQVRWEPGAAPIVRNLMDELGRSWYWIYWCRHRLVRPLENLKDWLRKRRFDSSRGRNGYAAAEGANRNSQS
jgi:glycosyltransferase involved in cell wall biosynthesis